MPNLDRKVEDGVLFAAAALIAVTVFVGTVPADGPLSSETVVLVLGVAGLLFAASALRGWHSRK